MIELADQLYLLLWFFNPKRVDLHPFERILFLIFILDFENSAEAAFPYHFQYWVSLHLMISFYKIIIYL